MSEEEALAASEKPALSTIDEAFDAAFDAAHEGDEAASKTDEAETTEKVETETPESLTAPDETETKDAPAEAEATDDTEASGVEPLDAPGHWSKEDKQAFEALDRAGQELIVQRDKHWQGMETRKSQELSEQAKFATDVQGIFTEADRQQMALVGMNEAAVIRQLLAYQRLATENPEAYVKQIAQRFNVDLNGSAPADQEEDEFLDPEIKQLRNQVKEQDVKIDGLYGQVQATRQSGEDAIIARFAAETDSEGNPTYPHFDQLRPRIGALIGSDPALVGETDPMKALAQGYEMAVMADPVLGKERIDQLAKDQLAAAEKQRELDKAKRAASPVTPKATVPSQRAKPPTDLGAIIDDVMDQMGVAE